MTSLGKAKAHDLRFSFAWLVRDETPRGSLQKCNRMSYIPRSTRAGREQPGSNFTALMNKQLEYPCGSGSFLRS